MKYLSLIELMKLYRLGRLTKNEMITAFELWQRPVECSKPFGYFWVKEAIEGVIR